MEKGYIENGFIVDLSNAHKTSEIIYELSRILDLPEAKEKKVCIKFGAVNLNQSQLISVKALIESMDSELEFISTVCEETRIAAESLGIKVSELENKVEAPEFKEETSEEKEENGTPVNPELENALDKIFGEGDFEERFPEEEVSEEVRSEEKISTDEFADEAEDDETIAEIKKQFTPDRCSITRICGCYVDGEKNKKTELKEAFLSLSEEETFKYFDIFRKTLTGTIGKNLINMEFPLDQEAEGGTQNFLMKLRESKLTDDTLTEAFYDKIIENYDYGENYYIILIHAVYDIPGKSSDGAEMFDASDEIYDHILCSICPVKLDKPGLCYNVSHNTIENRVQDWVAGAPENGFLFPAFTDRNTDIHNLLYFTKNAEMDQPDFLDHFLGCQAPLSAKSQKETFQSIIEETLDSACDFSTVMTIQENLNTMIEERKDDPEPVVLDKHEVKRLLASSGVPNEQLDEFDEKYESIADEKASFVASNVASTRNYEIRTPDVIIKVSPEKAQLIETRTIDGTPYILIEAADEVEINGILLKPSRPSDADDTEF